MAEVKKYELDDILSYLSGNAASNQEYCPKGFSALMAIGRGTGGFSNNALLIPESIHIAVTPVGCARHADFEIYADGDPIGRMYHIHLTESDVVVGTGVERVKDTVLELVDSLDPKPKAVTFLITCLDALLNTDYSPIGKELEKRYGIRFTTVKMFSFLNNSKKTHLMMMQESIFGMIRSSGVRNEHSINMIGNTALFTGKTEFKTVLNEAGYQVQEIRTCKTFEEFDQMADARLNVVLNPFAAPAAEMMKKKLGIPYVLFYECMDPEQIKRNYQLLEEELQCKLNYEKYYQKAIEKKAEFRALVRGKTFAVSDGFDFNPVKSAVEFAKLGGTVKYAWVQKFRKEDEKYYHKLKDLGQETVFYLASDYSLNYFTAQADYHVDYAVGIMPLLFMGGFGPKHLMLGEEAFDFETFTEMTDAMIQMIHQEDRPWGQNREATIFDRNWNMYRGNEYEEIV